jgi:PTH1 family peptidyl-tRNA hydrolase
MIYLAVFLGNPGNQYAFNRHNAGRLLAEKLPFFSSLRWQKKFKGLFSQQQQDENKQPLSANKSLFFLVPETYMNLSGISVRAAASFHKIKSDNIIVVHDELELPLGVISLKYGGGLGGHNGLRSIKQELGTADFWRLRLGIGRPSENSDISDWVLSDFAPAEKPLLETVLETGVNLLVRALTEEPAPLLDEWKKKVVTQSL